MTPKASDKRIRGRKLQAIRKRHFEQHPLCVECLKHGRITLATELDHIIALHNGGKDFDCDNGENRQGLCDDCHAKKTAKDLGHRETVAIDINGWPIK